ncbi:MAG: hypothetical protein OEY14_14490, partial [Myxococcales bacterium]|nr:hypothetical protein [Myxococcales bacterium]
DDYLRACFQQQLRDVFGLDSTPLIERCPECSGPMGGGLGQIAPFVAGQHPDFRMGLLATEGDSVIRSFFGYGYSPRCDLPTNMPIDEYQAGLYEMRDVILAPHPNFKFFVAPGEFHTFLGQPLGATRSSVGGITVGEWIRQLIDEDPAWDHLGP